MQASSRNSLARALLALLTLCGSAPGAVPGLGTGGNSPAGPGVRMGGDGVGGIDKAVPPHLLTAGTVADSLTRPSTPPLAQTGNGSLSGPWTDLGGALPGAEGVPRLVGSGNALPSTAIALHLVDAPAGGAAILVLGVEPAGIPFHGGLLVPRPDLILAGLPVDQDGQLTLSTVMPADAPAGLVLYMQAWLTDPAGWSSTNALRLITP